MYAFVLWLLEQNFEEKFTGIKLKITLPNFCLVLVVVQYLKEPLRLKKNSPDCTLELQFVLQPVRILA